jgi:hypothetical protein
VSDYLSLKINYELEAKHIDCMLKMEEEDYQRFLMELRYISTTHQEPARRNKMVRSLIEANNGYQKGK